MPYRALAITSRKHPIALGVYFGVVGLGIMHLTNLASATSMIAEVGEHVTFVWRTLLLVGGVITTISIFLPNKLLDRGLALEALGTFVIGMELLIYSVVMLGIPSPPWTTILSLAATAVGCLGRSFTSCRDRKRLLRAVSAQVSASPVPLGDPTHE